MLIIPVRDLAAGQVSLDLDWQHASPTGGFVTSDYWPRFNVERGHLVQVKGQWAVVQDIQRSAAGIWHLITWHGCLCVYSRFDGVPVRTDYRYARQADIRRARAFAARWLAETENRGESWQPSDRNLAQVFAGCVRPLARELYPLLREQLADRSWLEVSA